MNNADLPIVCSLTDAELQERGRQVWQRARQAVLEIKEIENGYAFRFPSDDVWLNEIIHIVSLERRCCPFLQFTVTVEADNGPIWLELTGPSGTKEFLASFLNWDQCVED